MKALDELSSDQIKALIGAGYRTVDDLRDVSVDELTTEVGLDAYIAQQLAEELALFKHKNFSAEHKHLLVVRKRHKKPWFKRDDYEKKKKLSSSWRKPRGLFNKMRRGFPDKGAVAGVGYGAPTAIRGFHPSGFEEVLVNCHADLEEVRPDQAVRIGRTVGARKKQIIVERAFAKGLKVLNPRAEGRSLDEKAKTSGILTEENE
ncbi:MAG: 50S ribosomal protein L32e [Halobacteriota archaeon]